MIPLNLNRMFTLYLASLKVITVELMNLPKLLTQNRTNLNIHKNEFFTINSFHTFPLHFLHCTVAPYKFDVRGPRWIIYGE